MIYEIRKSCRNIAVILTLLLCVVADIYKINEYYTLNYAFAGKGAELADSAYKTLLEEYSGLITQEKVNRITARFAPMENDFLNHNFDMEYNENYITGYFSRDYILYRRYIYNEMRRNAEYSSFAESITNLAHDNILFYTKYDNTYEIAKNELIADIYDNRQVAGFYDTMGWAAFFDYEFSSLMMLCIILLCVPLIFSAEESSGMIDINNTTVLGRSRLILRKIGACIIVVIADCVLFFAVDIAGFAVKYGLTNPFAPLYSIGSMVNTPFTVSILGGAMLTLMFRMIGALLAAFITALATVIIRKPLYSYIASGACIIIFIVSSHYFSLSPANLILSNDLLREFGAVDFGGRAVLSPVFMAIEGAVIIVIMVAIMIITDRRRIVKCTK